MDKKLLILYLLGAGDSKPVRGKTRLVKLMHIINEELKERNPEMVLYTFKPYYYGPYSDELMGDVEKLINEGYIDHRTEFVSVSHYGGYLENVYTLSEKGRDYLQENLPDSNIPESILRLIEETKSKYNDIPLSKLIRIVYSKYPLIRKKKRLHRLLL